MTINNKGKIFGFFIGGGALVAFVFSFLMPSSVSFENKEGDNPNQEVLDSTELLQKKEVKHIKTPEPLKAIYMTQCVVATPSIRERLVKLIEETELNAIIIDVKDYTGTVAFDTGIESIDKMDGPGCRTKDLEEFLEYLHDKNIYRIARLTVFQDPLYSKTYPEYAVKRESDKGVWKDRKGLSFVDVGAKPFWDYTIDIAKASYAIGFDEINFDYIRFPSDGNMQDIYFSHTGTTTKREMLRQFFEYLDNSLHESGIVTSADLFGMTTTNTDDLGIGQVLEYALMHFDYVAPMVYPSHYPPKFNGWPDPNKVPYEIIEFSMNGAISKLNFLKEEIASSTPNAKVLERLDKKQLRPWLQDFDYPVPYTAGMVRAQIQATYDVGLTSWMLWDPSNKYTRDALLPDAVPARP
jgi:hypothetical protein